MPSQTEARFIDSLIEWYRSITLLHHDDDNNDDGKSGKDDDDDRKKQKLARSQHFEFAPSFI
jgi:hypothetical protein